MTPNIEQMIETLLKVNFEGSSRKGPTGGGENNLKGCSSEGQLEIEECGLMKEADSSSTISKKKVSWQRLKRDSEEDLRDNNMGRLIGGKRDGDDAELSDRGITKKLKQREDTRGETFCSNAVAAQQPRGSP